MIPVNKIIYGAMSEAAKGFPDGSVNCCISSPPYWALRDYGVDGQLGLEKTFEEYIDKLCTIYDEVKRVLRDDGTCWVNLGDTYYSSSAGTGGPSDKQDSNTGSRFEQRKYNIDYPTKSLCLIPQRFAIEMVNRGWILRNVIIWHKPNPMPSSAKDRFTVDFEYIYFFVKNNNILWHFRPDGKVSDKQPDYKNGIEGLDYEWGTRKGKPAKISLWQGFKYWFEPQYEPNRDPGRRARSLALGRNKRTVWTIPTQSFPDAHFATFPEKLVEPMIKAGCPEFVCTKCGKAREKIIEFSGGTIGKGWTDHKADNTRGMSQDHCFGLGEKLSPTGEAYNRNFKGYTDCGCNADWRPGIVWDCFCWLWYDLTGSCKAAAGLDRRGIETGIYRNGRETSKARRNWNQRQGAETRPTAVISGVKFILFFTCFFGLVG